MTSAHELIRRAIRSDLTVTHEQRATMLEEFDYLVALDRDHPGPGRPPTNGDAYAWLTWAAGERD